MKQILIFVTFCLLTVSVSIAQPCRQIAIDSAQIRIFRSYIDECEREHFFVADKGVVVVTRFNHKSGRPAWRMNLIVDDRYKDNPPTEWAELTGDIILFYNADTQFSDPYKTTPTPDLLSCLDKVIGDRLYIRPPKSDRTIEVERPGKEPVKIDSRRTWGMSGLNHEIVIFETNGKVTILKSA